MATRALLGLRLGDDIRTRLMQVGIVSVESLVGTSRMTLEGYGFSEEELILIRDRLVVVEIFLPTSEIWGLTPQKGE